VTLVRPKNAQEHQPAPGLSISVVIPVYNSEETLGRLCQALAGKLPELTNDYEVILVNDASEDQSWAVILDLLKTYPWLQAVDLARNYGQHNALLCGIRRARKDVIITMDDDLQHPVEVLPFLLKKYSEGFDVVYGTPEREQHGFSRDLASQVTKIVLQSAMGAEVAREVSALRVFSTRLREGFQHFRGPFVSIDVLLTWSTNRFAAVRVRHDPRPAGASNYGFRKLMTHALNMMTGFSTIPLQLASWIGLGLTLFGLAVLVLVVGRYLLEGSVVPGFPFLASVIAIFSGAQLFALGIFGEYLARMYFHIIGKPPYVDRPHVPETGLPEKDES